MEIKAVVIDDETGNRENLRQLLDKYCKNVNVVAEASSATQGIEIIQANQPDLVFLDIEMPGSNGFDLLQHFSKVSFEVVFVTAYDQYAIRAIKFCALDYLLKPIDINELKDAVEKVAEKLKKDQEDNGLHVFMQNRLLDGAIKKIALPTSGRVDFVKVNEIVRCLGESNYTRVILKNGNEILVSRTLKEYEELLTEYEFMRVHQSHLINLAEVKAYIHKDGGYLLMNDESRVSVSRQKREAVMLRLSK